MKISHVSLMIMCLVVILITIVLYSFMTEYNQSKFARDLSLYSLRWETNPVPVYVDSSSTSSVSRSCESLSFSTPYNDDREVFAHSCKSYEKWRERDTIYTIKLPSRATAKELINIEDTEGNHLPDHPIIEGLLGAGDILGPVKRWLNDMVDDIISPIEDAINSAIQQIISPIMDFFNRIKNTLTNIIDQIRQGLDSVISKVEQSFNELKNQLQNAFQQIKQGLDGIISKIEQSFNELKNQLQNAFQQITNSFQSIFDKIENAVNTIKKRFDLLISAFDDIEGGIKGEFDALGDVIKTELEDVECVMQGGTDCAQHYINNFRSCSPFYFLDLMHQIFYGFFVRLPIWLVYTISGFDLMPYVRQIYNILTQIDDGFHSALGFSLLHFPDNVTKTCYSCPVDIDPRIARLKHDNNVCFPQWLNEPTKKFNDAASKFRGVFSTNF
jgi:predicted  nucleic acid-binding Zn-ribbon protein